MGIRVLMKKPGDEPWIFDIQNTLDDLQNKVGGYIETVTLASDLVIICNEEGRLKGLEYNCTICGLDLVGTIILCGTDGENFTDLPVSYGEMKKLFPSLWEV